MGRILWRPVDSFPGNSTAPTLASPRCCPVCGTDRDREVLSLPDFQFFTDSAVLPKRVTVRQVQCTSCRALYLNPAYTTHGFEVLFAEAGCSYGAAEAHPREQIDWLAERGLLGPGSSILDVGCYDGRFLLQLPNNTRRFGVDIDKPAIERGRLACAGQEIGLIHGDFSRFALEEAPDTITMFHVLEHLPDPAATLVNLRRMAHAGTSLVIEVPILEKGFTNDINSFFSIQHMTHFSRHSLASVLAWAGWEIVRQQDQPDYNGFRILARPAVPRPVIEAGIADDAILEELLRQRLASIEKIRLKLAGLGETEKIVVWGGGAHTELLYQLTDVFSPERTFIIVDSDPLKQGKSWRGINVYAPQCLPEVDWRETKLLVSSYGGSPAISRAARESGVPAERILVLYDAFYVY
jgi:SAM-dependent methyltransferase